MTATTQEKTKTKSTTKTSVDARAEVSRGTMIAITAVGAVVGLWALASLVGGMISAGGPVALVKAWVSAVVGM